MEANEDIANYEDIYANTVTNILLQLEASNREFKLSQSYWDKLTPVCLKHVGLHAITLTIQACEEKGRIVQLCDSESLSCNRSIDQSINRQSSCSLLHQSARSSVESQDSEQLEASAQSELDEYISESTKLQRALCPKLIQFWQTIPQQLRNEVKSRVVQELHEVVDAMRIKRSLDHPSSRQSDCNSALTNDSGASNQTSVSSYDVPDCYPIAVHATECFDVESVPNNTVIEELEETLIYSNFNKSRCPS